MPVTLYKSQRFHETTFPFLPFMKFMSVPKGWIEKKKTSNYRWMIDMMKYFSDFASMIKLCHSYDITHADTTKDCSTHLYFTL